MYLFLGLFSLLEVLPGFFHLLAHIGLLLLLLFEHLHVLFLELQVLAPQVGDLFAQVRILGQNFVVLRCR